jgi:hypothetical protein
LTEARASNEPLAASLSSFIIRISLVIRHFRRRSESPASLFGAALRVPFEVREQPAVFTATERRR